ncbi:MAG: helix-turn-helix transcriptional regulator [Proteiniphilum sp.]
MLNIANIRREWFIEQIVALKNSGIQYAEIAARLGVRPQYLNSIKNSERGASENLTIKLCKAFNINHNDLWERISNYEKTIQEISEVSEPGIEINSPNKIPLYSNTENIGQNREKGSNVNLSIKRSQWIGVADLFPDATSAICHYGDSMPEYASGSILVLKQLRDIRLIVWGRNYYVKTSEFGIIRKLQDGGESYILGYSSNEKTYPDGRLIHEPISIPKESIRHISLVLGYVIKEFGD